MQERGSDKHGPALDDEMKNEIQGAMKARRPTRAQEEREPEPLVTDEGEVATDPVVERDTGTGQEPERE